MKTIEEIRGALRKMHHRACGDTSAVYMSVPADRERDADLILEDAITELGESRAKVAKLREALEGMIRAVQVGLAPMHSAKASLEECVKFLLMTLHPRIGDARAALEATKEEK